MVLVFEPKLTHSIWMDVICRARSAKGLERHCREGVRDGRYVGYRIITNHFETLGICKPNYTSEPK